MTSIETPTRPTWLGPARDALDAYRQGTDRMFALLPSWEAWAPDDDTRELLRLGGESARARAAVAREWMISPLWITGIASPAELQEQVQHVIDIDRRIGVAWAAVVRRQSRRMTTDAREAVSAVEGALDRTEKLAEEAASGMVSAAGSTATAAQEAVDKAIDGAEKAIGTLRPVKANVNRDGEKIFHVPGQSSYEQLEADQTFVTQSEAIEQGYRIARSRGGPAIKGNIARDGSRVYHKPGQANYERVDAEALFETEEAAIAEGFRPASR